MEHCRFKNTGLTSKELLDTLTSLLTGDNKCVYDAIEGKDIKDIIFYNLSFFNNDEIKNMVKIIIQILLLSVSLRIIHQL